MRDVIWLVWDRQHLRGMFGNLADAQHRQKDVRTELGAASSADPQWFQVRIEAWTIAPPTGSPSRESAGEQHRHMFDMVDREWGLLAIPEMGTGHFFHLNTYLLVPYDNELTCPGFQFTLSGELWPGFRDVLQVFRDAGWDEFSICMWFVSRQGTADGGLPALLIRDEPRRVYQAARSTTLDW